MSVARPCGQFFGRSDMKANQWIDPRYVQVSKKEAASICGLSISEFDRRRSSDPDCPKGFKESPGRTAPVRFRLADIYAYSEAIMERALSHSG